MTSTLHALQSKIIRATVEVLDGLVHTAPDKRAPKIVAGRVLDFLLT